MLIISFFYEFSLVGGFYLDQYGAVILRRYFGEFSAAANYAITDSKNTKVCDFGSLICSH